MMTVRKILLAKAFIFPFFFMIFVAVAIPGYINLNKSAEANQCRDKQVIVETALALAYAESLAVGSDAYPKELTASMFEDGRIPVCPIHNCPIEFDRSTGTACCPNHIKMHQRIY